MRVCLPGGGRRGRQDALRSLVVEVSLLAARSTSASNTSTKPAPPPHPAAAPFPKIAEPLEVPQLLSLQTTSFDWLVGNERWEQKVQAARTRARTSPSSGLQEIFEEIFPIEDFFETMSLSFEDPGFYAPKYPRRSQGERLHLLRPLYVLAEFTSNDTG